MATFLKNLKVKSVDFVSTGANPDAHIKLYKSKEPPAQADDSGVLKHLSDKIAKALQSVFKEAKTFDEQYDSKKAERLASAVRDEVWTMTYALNESICSIVADEDMDNEEKRLEAIQNSLSEFMDEAESASENWAAIKPHVSVAKGKMSAERLEAMVEQRNRLDELINRYKAGKTDDNGEGSKKVAKGDGEENKSKEEEIDTMVIEKSKMTAEELSFLEEIEKKYGSEEGAGEGIGEGTPPVTKKAEEPEVPEIHPEVAKALTEVEEIKKSLEMQQMSLVAKKYEILGKKPEELAKSLVDVKKAGDEAYNSYIAALDAHLDTVEKSGVFKEIGTSAEGGAGSEWAQIEKAASEIMTASPNLTREQAIDKACQNHPELVQGYEKSLTGRR